MLTGDFCALVMAMFGPILAVFLLLMVVPIVYGVFCFVLGFVLCIFVSFLVL